MKRLFLICQLTYISICMIFKLIPVGQIHASASILTPHEKIEKTELAAAINLALQNHKMGLFEEALSQYETVIPHVNGQLASTLHSNAGVLYMNFKGDYEKAKTHFMQAVDAMPNNAQGHLNLAIVLTTKLQLHAQALKHCKLALQIDPTMHKALHLIGNILQSMGRPEQADFAFKQAATLASKVLASTSPTTVESSLLKWDVLRISQASIGDKFIGQHDSVDYTMTCISIRPLVFYVAQLLTPEECHHIRSRSEGMLERSFVMGGGKQADTGHTCSSQSSDAASVISGEASSSCESVYRSSYNAWLSPDEVLVSLQHRIAAVTGLPAAYLMQKSEELQVVKYERGGEFKVHHDSSAFHIRLMTTLVYLNDVPDDGGGGTWFPFSRVDDEGIPSTIEEAISQALELSVSVSESLPGLTQRPVAGSAVIFFNHLPSGQIDPTAGESFPPSLHLCFYMYCV